MGSAAHFPSSWRRHKSGHKQKSFGNLISLWAHLFCSAKWENPTSTRPAFSVRLRKRTCTYKFPQARAHWWWSGPRRVEQSQAPLCGDAWPAVTRDSTPAPSHARSPQGDQGAGPRPLCKDWFMAQRHWSHLEPHQKPGISTRTVHLLDQSLRVRQDPQVTDILRSTELGSEHTEWRCLGKCKDSCAHPHPHLSLWARQTLLSP